jgi:hypothetical protein
MNEDKSQKGSSYDKGASAPSYDKGASAPSRKSRTKSYVGRTVTEDELKVLRKEKAIRDEKTRILREKEAAEGYRDKGAPAPSYDKGAPPLSGDNGADSRHNLGYEEGAPPSGTPPTGV